MLLDLSNNEQYNIASAIRGPDNEDMGQSRYFSDHVKTLHTSVIRYFVGIAEHNKFCDCKSPATAKLHWDKLSDSERTEYRAAMTDRTNYHFVCHSLMAFRALAEGNSEAAEYLTWLKSLTPNMIDF